MNDEDADRLCKMVNTAFLEFKLALYQLLDSAYLLGHERGLKDAQKEKQNG